MTMGMDKSTLEGKVLSELQQIASGLGIESTQRLREARHTVQSFPVLPCSLFVSSDTDRKDHGCGLLRVGETCKAAQNWKRAG